MFNLLKVIDLGGAATDAAAHGFAARLNEAGKSLPGIRSQIVGETLPRALNGGQIMWRAVFASEADYRACMASPAWRSQIDPLLAPETGVMVDSVVYATGISDTAAGRQRGGIWRCLVMSVETGTPTVTIRRFEKDLLLMPRFIGAIRNWALSPVILASGRRRWTHVWEQEFDDIAGLEGEDMVHPIHWGLVDGWFDPECPQRIVDPLLIHAACAIEDRAIF